MPNRSKYMGFAAVEDPKKGTTTGMPLPKDQPVVDWWSNYISSPKYKERLAAFYKYPDYIQRLRSGILNETTFRENPGTSSAYYNYDNELAMSQLQVDALNTTRGEVMAHELGHTANSNKHIKGASLSPAEEDFILKRNKQVSPATYERVKTQSKESGKAMIDILDKEQHDVRPNENLSDIQALRFLMKQRKIHDAGTENVTPEIIKKAATDPVIRKSFIWKRLKESFDEKALQEILNTVATNKNKKVQNIA